MADYSAWQYDEMQQIGKDYGNVAEVEAYDSRYMHRVLWVIGEH